MAIFPTRFEGDHGRQLHPAFRHLCIVAPTVAAAYAEADRRAQYLADFTDSTIHWRTQGERGEARPTPPTISPRRTS
jgi:hypothetical protein